MEMTKGKVYIIPGPSNGCKIPLVSRKTSFSTELHFFLLASTFWVFNDFDVSTIINKYQQLPGRFMFWFGASNDFGSDAHPNCAMDWRIKESTCSAPLFSFHLFSRQCMPQSSLGRYHRGKKKHLLTRRGLGSHLLKKKFRCELPPLVIPGRPLYFISLGLHTSGQLNHSSFFLLN